ncbi:glycosyltransferase family 2 protein [Mediterraneibacter agrestimuris]|uniref:glycosyltransferase family 2 protein n=1 Tax=Mediterraneibacter agrestimuris TaxID=2941333 RepID=UPI00203B7B70|nr:glycosyltransferase family 2 protein [Mediterraneibacter agrestimuris]
MLSIVLPAYNENTNVVRAYHAIKEILTKEEIPFELVFVNDGSKDDTWSEIRKVVETAKKEKTNEIVVKGVDFSRNFGKEAAILAGLANAQGDAAVVMDCDLQHPPQVLIEMYKLWQNGYEVVEGVKRSRGKENPVYKAGAKIFYGMMTRATKIDMSRASDFKLLDKKAVKSILCMPERNMFFRGLSAWVGFKKTEIEFDVQERVVGESKWSKWSLVKYAVKNIAAFSTAPMQLVTIAGGLTFIGAVILGIQTLVKYFIGHAVQGFTTVILLLLIIGSVIMMSLGIVGYYIAKIYEEVKRRPVYIITEIIQNQNM